MGKRTPTAHESINYSFVPNHRETMEALVHSRLSAREFRCVILIMNQTDGYLRLEDTIKPHFFFQRTGIDTDHLANVLQRLLKWQVIYKDKDTFRVNPPSEWTPDALLPKTTKNGGSPKPPKTVALPPKTVVLATKNGGLQITPKEEPKENLLKKTPVASSPKATGKLKPRQQETGAFLDWVSEEEHVKFPNRGKLMHLIRTTLVATQATGAQLQEWYTWVRANDTYWGRREPPVILGQAPNLFPTWLRDRKEGRPHGGREQSRGTNGEPRADTGKAGWGPGWRDLGDPDGEPDV